MNMMCFATHVWVGINQNVLCVWGAMIQYSGNKAMIDPLAEFGRAAESRTARWRGILSATRSSTPFKVLILQQLTTYNYNSISYGIMMS